MNIKQEKERVIIVRAVFIGREPCYSKPGEPFFLGSMKVIESISPENKLSVQTSLGMGLQINMVNEAEIIFGAVVTKDNKIGFNPGTQLALFNVPLSLAKSFNDEKSEIKDWRFEKLSFSKYRRLLEKKFDDFTKARDEVWETMTRGWMRFLYTGNMIWPQTITVRIAISDKTGKHFDVSSFTSKVDDNFEPLDAISAAEYFEQFLVFLNRKGWVQIDFDKEKIYKTPHAIIDKK